MKNMNILKGSIAAALISLTPYTFAGEDSNGFYVWADVTEVDPIVTTAYERVPVKHCKTVRPSYQEQVRYDRAYNGSYRDEWEHRNSHNNDALPALVGGLLGGAIGNQFGSGNGKKAMTVFGTILGATIAANGNDRNHNPNSARRSDGDYRYSSSHSPQQVCDTSYERQEYTVVDGYRVTYRYLGREFERVTDEHPGNRLKLYVTVDPVDSDVI